MEARAGDVITSPQILNSCLFHDLPAGKHRGSFSFTLFSTNENPDLKCLIKLTTNMGIVPNDLSRGKNQISSREDVWRIPCMPDGSTRAPRLEADLRTGGTLPLFVSRFAIRKA
jgi:hypothetical protein